MRKRKRAFSPQAAGKYKLCFLTLCFPAANFCPVLAAVLSHADHVAPPFHSIHRRRWCRGSTTSPPHAQVWSSWEHSHLLQLALLISLSLRKMFIGEWYLCGLVWNWLVAFWTQIKAGRPQTWPIMSPSCSTPTAQQPEITISLLVRYKISHFCRWCQMLSHTNLVYFSQLAWASHRG